MKRVFLGWSRVAVFVLVGSWSGSALACCDNFWSCAGAFFTAGASCAVEAAQRAISEFVQRVERTRTEGEQQMQSMTRDLDQEAASSCRSEDDRVAQGLAKATAAQGQAKAAADAKRSSLPANVNATLQKAQTKLDQMQAEAKALKEESAAKANQAASVRQTKVRALNTAFQASFIAPLSGLVAPLIAALDPISAAATIAVLADQFGRIQAETERAVAQGVDSFDEAMNGLIQELKAKGEAQAKRAQEAQDLGAAMQTLASAPTEQNRQRVETLLGNPRPMMVAKAKFAKLNFNAVALSKAKTVPTLKSALAADATFARRVKVNTTVAFDKAAAEQRTRGELDKRLEGKTGDALEGERKKLLAEAADYFKKDQKARDAVQKAINEAVDRRKPAAAKLKPVKPMVPVAPIKK